MNKCPHIVLSRGFRFGLLRIAMVSLLSGSSVFAQTLTFSWSGNSVVDDNWNNGANWTTANGTGVAPLTNSGGSVYQVIITGPDATANVVSSNAVITLGRTSAPLFRALLVGGNNTSNSSLSGNGSLTLTGGLITTLGLTGNQSAADLFGDSGRTGTLTLSGGNYTATHTMVGGASSVGALVINSGSTATISRWTTVGTGSVTLNAGGTFRSSESLFGGNGASMTINFNGGVFVATANHTLISNAGNFASISRNYNVQSGGAVINTNGFNVTAPGGFLGATGGGLTKQGSGNLTLSGNQASTYNGATIVSAGTLILTGNASISSTSGINVASGATFNNSSNFTVSEAFTLTEGAALAGNQSITMLGATIAADLANGFTSISAGANVGRGGALTFQLTNLTDGSYTIFSGSMTGNFTSVLIGVTALTDLGNGTFSGSVGGYDYLYASSSNSLSISAIPEPAAVAMVLFGAIGLMLRRRRLPAD